MRKWLLRNEELFSYTLLSANIFFPKLTHFVFLSKTKFPFVLSSKEIEDGKRELTLLLNFQKAKNLSEGDMASISSFLI